MEKVIDFFEFTAFAMKSGSNAALEAMPLLIMVFGILSIIWLVRN